MHKIIAATLLSLSLAAPAFAYSNRAAPFDPAAELQRATGSAQYPESGGGIVRDARVGRGGSEAYPQITRGIASNGADMLVGGSSRYPVLTPDVLSHPPTALDQDQVLVDGFDGGPAPVSVSGSVSGDADG